MLAFVSARLQFIMLHLVANMLQTARLRGVADVREREEEKREIREGLG